MLVIGLTTRSFQLFHCRPHDAQEVYVTGTFDNWSKSERLEKVDGVWQKTVILPERAEKFYYKVGAASLLLSSIINLPSLHGQRLEGISGRAAVVWSL